MPDFKASKALFSPHCVLIATIILVIGLAASLYPATLSMLSNSAPSASALAAPLQQRSCLGLSILLVATGGSSTNDRRVQEYLVEQGYEVTVTTVGGYTDDLGAASDLIMISRSVPASTIGDQFTQVATPVLTWEGFIYDKLLMTGTVQGIDYGRLAARSEINVVDSSHSIAAGLSGIISTHESKATFQWGAPSAQANIIALIGDSDAQAAIFAYESGAQMVGDVAPARRVGLHDVSLGAYSSQGDQLFDTATEWALNCAPSAPVDDEFTLTVEIEGEGSVMVSPDSDTYQNADLVILEAFPADGWSFVGWSGNVVTGLNPTIIVFDDQDEVVKADFELLPTPSITPTVTVTPTVSITVTPTITPAVTVTPSVTITPTLTPAITPTIVLTPTATQIAPSTATPTLMPTPMPTATPILTTTLEPTVDPTVMATLTLTPTIIGTPVAGSGSGTITRELWYGIEDGYSIDSLTTLPSYPAQPDDRTEITEFRIPRGGGELYGTRIHGYIHPPVSGAYTFYIAGDDRGRLFLSADDSPENAAQIADVPGWTYDDEWDKFPEQQSLVILLEAGKRYYIKALHVQGSAGDHLSVGWNGPDISTQVIEGQYLSPFLSVEPPAPTVTATLETAVPMPTVVVLTATPTPAATIAPSVEPTAGDPTATALPQATATPIAIATVIATVTAAPTSIANPEPPQLLVALRDNLFIDKDSDGESDPGDTLLYHLEIRNQSGSSAESIVLQLLLDEIMTINPNSVAPSQGTIVKGNQEGDQQVVISIGNIPPGGAADVTFEVQIAEVLSTPREVVTVQGTIVGQNIPETKTDDPDSAAVDDPTSTILSIERDLSVTKTDLLFVDADNDQQISPEDLLIYVIRIQNNGALPVTQLRLIDTPDEDTSLVTGQVTASRGDVISGNLEGDKTVEVMIPEIRPGEDVFVQIRAKINNELTDSQLHNQATVTLMDSDDVSGQNQIQSDDPDVVGSDNPTITRVFTQSENSDGDAPKALEFTDWLYLPLISQALE